MEAADKSSQAFALAAELGAALGARKASLEYERRFAASDQADRLNRELFQIRVYEARLKDVQADPLASVEALGPLAVTAAEDLEAEAEVLKPLLGADAAGRRIGVLRLVCAMERLSRLGDARARAALGASRQGRKLPGFEDALDLALEDELYYLALRRFEGLMADAKAWDLKDADWLRLRVAAAPGRLRLHAAALRAAAEAVAGQALPPALRRAREPFLAQGFEPAVALAWAVAGFSPGEAKAWGEAGLGQAQRALAWHDRGMGPAEAAAWMQADLLADEAAAFKDCGAADPAMALALRHELGDVEQVLAWHRAGFEMAEVLKLRHQGVRQPPLGAQGEASKAALRESAPGTATAASASAPAPASSSSTPGSSSGFKISHGGFYGEGAPPPRKAEAAPKEDGEASLEPGAAPVRKPKPALTTRVFTATSWAQDRAQARFGAECSDDASALAARPPEGGAWLVWGAYRPGADAAGAGGSEMAASLPLDGGLVDAVLASEHVLLPGHHAELHSMEPVAAWQARLDQLAASRQAPAVPGRWLLAAWAPQKARFFWGLAFGSEAPPWADAVDYDPKEGWEHRWARKADEWGEAGLEPRCSVGRTAGGGWWVAASESLHESPESGCLGLESRWPSPAWRHALEDFCLKMEMGAHSPQWLALC